MHYLNIIVYSIGLILILGELIRCLQNRAEINSVFKCPHCSTHTDILTKHCECKKCHRKIDVGFHMWKFLALQKILYIDNEAGKEYKYDFYNKVVKKDLIIVTIAIIVFILGFLIEFIN